jgi:hypothetical protein
MSEPDGLSKSFGLSIAFLLPGLVGLNALSFLSPAVATWFGVAADKNTTVGGFLFVSLGSVGMGVFISGVRWLVLEHWLEWIPKAPEGLDVARRKDEHCEAAYQDLILRHYQFYQFYANTPFALLLVFIAWVFANSSQPPIDRIGWTFILMAFADFVLLASAKNAITRYDEKVIDLLGLKSAAA